MGFSLQLGLAALLFMSGLAEAQDGTESNHWVNFTVPFQYFGKSYNSIFQNEEGYLSFSESTGNPDLEDIIAPLWTNFSNGNINITFEQNVQLTEALHLINSTFPNLNFVANMTLTATWTAMQYATGTGGATFHAVLTSDDEGLSFVVITYENIDTTEQNWRAGYNSEINAFSIDESSPSKLNKSSNVNFPGRWIFRVDHDAVETCDTLNCSSQTEVCTERTGVYGCACSEGNPRPNPNTYDFTEICHGSSGEISLSRCQLFEAGFFARFLHLQERSCRGKITGDRVVFHFDNKHNLCGTTLTSNSTHFIYENSIQSIAGSKTLISRDNWLGITFSCVYPLIQSISMTMPIHANKSVISKELSTEGTYEIHMTPYSDETFTSSYTGEVLLEVNQQMYVSVDVAGVDPEKIAIVLDSCWATPVNDSQHKTRWDLITNECPNPNDGTVQVLMNGVSTSARFSFRMFTFTAVSDQIFLHCQVHLCLLEEGECAMHCNGGHALKRRRRSSQFHDSAAITIGF